MLRQLEAEFRYALLVASKKHFGIIQVESRCLGSRATAEAQPNRQNMAGFPPQYYFNTSVPR